MPKLMHDSFNNNKLTFQRLIQFKQLTRIHVQVDITHLYFLIHLLFYLQFYMACFLVFLNTIDQYVICTSPL